MPLRQQPYGAGSRPKQPNSQGHASQQGQGNPEETYQEYGAGDDQDMQEQYQDQGEEGGNEQYGEDQGQGDWQEEEDGDPQDKKEDEGEKGGAGAESDVGKLQHSKFPQDPHHSETMSLFHQIASQGFTEDHVHSFIHVLVLIVAMLAYHSGMTAGHHKTHTDLPSGIPSASNSTITVAFEKLAEQLIEDLAKEVIGEIIQAIEQLITDKADDPIREAFTQSNLVTAAGLVNEPVNVLIIFSHDPHDASDLLAKGWKMGMLKCPCPHAGNTLLYECYIGKKAAVFHLIGDGGYINWAFSGKFNRHGNDVSFEDV